LLLYAEDIEQEPLQLPRSHLYWHGTVATAANIPFSITPTTIGITKFTADIDDVDITTYTPTNPDLVIVAITLIVHFYFFYFAVPAVAIRTTGKEVPSSIWTGPPPSQSRSLSSTGACEGVLRNRRFKPRSAPRVHRHSPYVYLDHRKCHRRLPLRINHADTEPISA
jgi:hypothetical protein